MADSFARDMARFDTAKRRKAMFDQTYQEAIQFGAPQRDIFYDAAVEGARRDNADFVFDSTAQNGMNKFASNLQSSLVPPMKIWSKMEPGDGVNPNVKEKAAVDLQTINTQMFRFIQNSNFDTQISESFLDLAVGVGALMIERGTRENPFNFVSCPIAQLVLEESYDGRVGMVGREHNVAYRCLLEKWPDAILDAETVEKMKTSPDKTMKLIELTVPQRVKVRQGGKMTEVDGYRYVVMNAETKKYIVKRLQRSSPWVVFRWSVMPGEVYGRGPLLQAIADVKTLNKAKELTLKNAVMEVSGCWMVVDNGVVNVNTIEFTPGGAIAVESNSEGGLYGPSIKRLPSTGNFDVSELIIKDLQASIREALFVDPLGPIDLPVKSATEVSLRQTELSKRIGSAFGRLQFELIAPLINRLLNIMEELGLIDLQNYRVDGNMIAIRHISPLAMAQDEEELMSLLRYGEYMSKTLGPQAAMMVMKPQKFAAKIAELLHIDKDMIPSAAEFEKLQQLVLQMAAAQQGQKQGA